MKIECFAIRFFVCGPKGEGGFFLPVAGSLDSVESSGRKDYHVTAPRGRRDEETKSGKQNKPVMATASEQQPPQHNEAIKFSDDDQETTTAHHQVSGGGGIPRIRRKYKRMH